MTQSLGQDQHFQAYYHDNALLIQFIVIEFLAIAHLDKKLKLLTDASLDFNKEFDPLFSLLNHLIGTVLDQDSLSSSPWSTGPLTKLKDYTEQCYRNIRSPHSAIENLHTYVFKSWLGALQCKELLSAVEMGKSIKVTMIKQSFNHLHTSFGRMTRLIPPLIEELNTNDYVLFFLYRMKDQLVAIYGTTLVNKLLKMNKGVDKKTELYHSFKEKGFDILTLHSGFEYQS